MEEIVPLFRACQILGKRGGYSFTMPSGVMQQRSLFAQLEAICNTSDIRFRQIRLEGLWWKEDGGDFLGFLNKHPVACLWRGGKYYLINSETEKEEQIDKKVAEKIKDVGFEFYPHTFKPLKLQKLISFLLGKESGSIAALLIFGVAITLLNLSIPFALKALFDDLVAQSGSPFFLKLGMGLVLVILLSCTLQAIAAFILFRLLLKGVTRIQKGFWDRFFRMPSAFFKRIGKAELWTKVTQFSQLMDFFSVRNFILLFFLIFSLFFLIPMLHFSPYLTLISLVITFFFLLVASIALFLLNKAKQSLTLLQKKGQKFLYQLFLGFRKIREMGAENEVFAAWSRNFASLKKKEKAIQKNHYLLEAYFYALPLFFLFSLFTSLIIAPFATKTLTLGSFFAFLFSYILFSLPLFLSLSLIFKSGPLLSLWQEVRALFEVPQELVRGKVRPIQFDGSISVENLCVRYPQSEKDALNALSLQIKPGSCVGITGPSGSGKTTFLRTLLELEKPLKGEILIDEIPIEKYDIHFLKRRISALFHENSFLEGVIYENLRCGRFPKEEDWSQALSISGLKEVLKDFPMGLYTPMINGGATLSSTEKERLLIARALLYQPQILLIDDVLTALSETEYLNLIDHLKRLKCTKIIVTQREEALKKMDYIYFFKKGFLSASGTYNNIINYFS